MYEQEHKCLLSLRQTKPVLAPLHPAQSRRTKLKHLLRKLTILNENDVRCKHFFRSGAALRLEQGKHANSPYWYIINPFSILNHIIVVIYFLTLIHRGIFPKIMLRKPYWYILTSIIRDCVHVLVMLTFFFTGYAETATKNIYTVPRKTIRHYLHGYFFIDLYFLIDGNYDYASDFLFKFISKKWDYTLMIPSFKISLSLISFVFYAIRFNSLSYVITNIAFGLGLGTTSIFIIRHGTIMIYIVNLYTLLFFKIPYYIYYMYNSYPRDSWIFQRNLTFEEYTVDTYTNAFLIIASYFVGSNFSDFIKQPCEQLMLFICTLGGRLYTLFIIGKVLAHFGFRYSANNKYENMMFQFNSYIGTLGVPTEMKTRFTEKFEYMCQKKYFNQDDMKSTVTDHLKIELFLHGAKRLVIRNRFLNHLNATELAQLFSHMKSSTYGSHEVVFGGIPTTYLYFLQSGSGVGYSNDQEVFHVEDGDVFGIQAIYPASRNEFPFYVITIEPSEVYYVNTKWIIPLIENHPDLGKLLVDVLKKRIDSIIQEKKRNYYGYQPKDYLKQGRLLESMKKRPSVVS